MRYAEKYEKIPGKVRGHCKQTFLSFQTIFQNSRVAVKCLICPDFYMCPECFAARVELGNHSPSHPYKLIDSGGFQLFKSDWSAKYDKFLRFFLTFLLTYTYLFSVNIYVF